MPKTTVPILSGIYSDTSQNMRVSLPVNLIPLQIDSGMGHGYLRPAWGISTLKATNWSGNGGPSRGAIVWNNIVYRVIGAYLYSFDSNNNSTQLGYVGNDGKRVSMDYSYDALCISSCGNVYFWNLATSTLTQLASPNLTTPIVNVAWVQGYFVLTDTKYMFLTDIVYPTTVVDADAYYQSNTDPSPMMGFCKIRNELYVIMRYTMDVMYNNGSGNQPFQPILGAQSMKGAVGPQAFCYLTDSLFFIGGARNEDIGVYIGYNGINNKISTREIDLLLNSYTTVQLQSIFVEKVFFRDVNCIFVHLPDRVLVYDASATVSSGKQIWYVLTSAFQKDQFSRFLGIDFVFNNGLITMGHPIDDRIGTYVDFLMSHWEAPIRWQVSTAFVFNTANGFTISYAELVVLQGTMQIKQGSSIGTDFSEDGITWSVPRFIQANPIGNTIKRLIWLRLGWSRIRRIQRFFGDSNGPLSIVALIMDTEGMIK